MREEYNPITLTDILNFRAREYCLGGRKFSEVRADRKRYLEFIRCAADEFKREVIIFFARDYPIVCGENDPQFATIFMTWVGTPPKGYLVLNTLPFCHPDKKNYKDLEIKIEEASLVLYFQRRRRVLPKRGIFGWRIKFEDFLKCKWCHLRGIDPERFLF